MSPNPEGGRHKKNVPFGPMRNLLFLGYIIRFDTDGSISCIFGHNYRMIFDSLPFKCL